MVSQSNQALVYASRLDYLGLDGVGLDPKEGLTIPALTFMIFQSMFAVITVAIITGSFVERIKFSSFLIFSLAWVAPVYDPIAHWVWGPRGSCWFRSVTAWGRSLRLR
ncbi:MAG: hypothetical protein MUO26_10860 [Methanotrichaceae archaeon]|nr:hypothetical protein [Methanotrichaceae archaeon]